MINNKTIYGTSEFSNWSDRKGLLPEEKILIDKFFKKELSTVEAGVAGGRILFALHSMGFESLSGFDFVEEFIDSAIKKDKTDSISFTVQDASNLNYTDNSFEQAVYFQQIICFIEDEEKRLSALKECYRILKPGGVVLFSFLSYESKKKKTFYEIFVIYLKFLRKLFNKKLSLQYLPWLKLNKKINWNAIFDKQPYNYWYFAGEVYNFLEQAGFDVLELGYPEQIIHNKMHLSVESLTKDIMDGHIYFVCKKINSLIVFNNKESE